MRRKIKIRQKALLAFSLLSFFVSFAQNQDDCEIIRYMIAQYQKEQICLIDRNDNEAIIKNLKWLKEAEETKNAKASPNEDDSDNTFVKMVRDYKPFEQLDSLRILKGEKGLFFSSENCEYFSGQQTPKNSKWKLKGCGIKQIKLGCKKKHKGNRLYISKPIYTKDKKYAIVDVYEGKGGLTGISSYVVFYKDDELGWIRIDSYWYGLS